MSEVAELHPEPEQLSLDPSWAPKGSRFSIVGTNLPWDGGTPSYGSPMRALVEGFVDEFKVGGPEASRLVSKFRLQVVDAEVDAKCPNCGETI